MILTLDFSELQKYVASHFGKDIVLSSSSEKTVNVGVALNLLIARKTAGLDVTIEQVEPADITISYSGHFGVGTIIGGVLSFVKKVVPGFIEVLPNQRLKLKLGMLEAAKAMVDSLDLEDISFTSSAVIVHGHLK